MVNYKDAIARARELLGTPYGTGEGALDCIGLIVRVIRTTTPGGIRGYKTAGTDTLWSSYNSSQKYRDLNWRRVGTDGARPGMLAFKGSGTDKQGDGQPHHVGLVAEKNGELTVIHASSANGKVVETPLYGPYGWTLLAIHRYIEPQAEKEGTPMDTGERVYYRAKVTTSGGKLNVRSGPSKDDQAIFKLSNGAVVDVMMELANGWAFIDDDGMLGYASMQYLQRIEKAPADAPETPPAVPETPGGQTPAGMVWGVFLPNLSREKAEAIAAETPGAILTAYHQGGND